MLVYLKDLPDQMIHLGELPPNQWVQWNPDRKKLEVWELKEGKIDPRLEKIEFVKRIRAFLKLTTNQPEGLLVAKRMMDSYFLWAEEERNRLREELRTLEGSMQGVVWNCIGAEGQQKILDRVGALREMLER